MSKTTTRQGLDRIRRAILALDDPIVGTLTDDEVTINIPNLTTTVKRCITLSCTGFPLKRRNDKQRKRFIVVEYRQTMELTGGVYAPSVDDVIDSAYNLSEAMTRNDMLGIMLEPDQDAIEGVDDKFENAYMVAWRYLATL